MSFLLSQPAERARIIVADWLNSFPRYPTGEKEFAKEEVIRDLERRIAELLPPAITAGCEVEPDGYIEPEKKPRRKYGEGRAAQRKAWELQMRQLPGLFIPIRTMSEMNRRDHWAAKDRRRKAQMVAVFTEMNLAGGWQLNNVAGRCVLTRYGPRKLDTDNLAASFKFIRDEIAFRVGVDDGDERWEWEYKQEISGFYGIRIERKPA